MNDISDNARQFRPRRPWDMAQHAAVDGVWFVTLQEFLSGYPPACIAAW